MKSSLSDKVQHVSGAFLHLPGFGPRKVKTIHEQGISTWTDLLHHHHQELPGLQDNAPNWVKMIRECEQAVAGRNLNHLVNILHRSDQWRILADFMDQATFLDIETSGDQLQPDITLIICKHRGKLHIFTAEHNLNQFLNLLDEITLLVTFNGASFDVPQLERHFRLPFDGMAHIDLRWVCYHEGLRGGLKKIERAIGLVRPADLIGIDGADADWLWRGWKETGNINLLQRLTRYCAADVIGLEHLSNWLIARKTTADCPAFHWKDLPESNSITPPVSVHPAW